MIDLDDIGSCPLGVRCESCGAERADLATETVHTGLGVMCLTLCPPCATSGMAPPVTVGTAARLVAQHCAHLNITADQMAVALGANPS